MILEESAEHHELLLKTIKYLEKAGHLNIEAMVEGYPAPKSYTMKGSGIEITPDIVSESVSGKVSYIEVGLKSEQKSLLISKWKFLTALAEIKNRRFQIVTHKGHYSFTDGLVSELKLENKVIKI